MSQEGHERRTFFACEVCNIVYADVEKPPICHNCGNNTFTAVVPETDTD